ncbi:MAG: hypothetical protein HKN22_07945 [Bacteroidia bacterium]|nr:hypothetical protein [Bacteroidia bacterium]
MILRSLALVTISTLLLTSCEEESLLTEPQINPGFDAIHYDDGNIDAPLLPAGSYEAAVKFPSNYLAANKNDSIKEVHFFIQELPNVCKVKFYSSFSGQLTPGNLLYSQNVISEIQANSWNRHVLSSPLIIGNEDIWISISFESNTDNRVVGCDPGPASENGEWLWDAAVGSWDKLSNNSTLDIDWNIRLAVKPS